MKTITTETGQAVLYTQTDLARAMGIHTASLHCRIFRSRTIPAPTHGTGQRKHYTEEEFRRIIGDEVERTEARLARLKQ